MTTLRGAATLVTGGAGTIGSTPAVVNAIVDALSDFGVTNIDMPVRSEKVWKILKGRKAS